MITIYWLTRRTRQLPEGGDEVTNVYEELLIEGHPLETYRVQAKATTHPVERSADIADHTVALPRELDLECVVTPGALDDRIPFDPDRITTALAQLERLIATGTPVDVDTDRGLFENFLLLGRTEERSVDVGEAAKFTLTIQELLTADVEEVAAPAPTVERARRPRDRGTQSPQNTGQTTETPQSVSAAALDAIGAAFLNQAAGGGGG